MTKRRIRKPASKSNSKSEAKSRSDGGLSDQAKNTRGLGTELHHMIRPEDRGDDLVFEYSGGFPKPPTFD
jgi:hypothetical protein